jgi:cell division protease FtsH
MAKAMARHAGVPFLFVSATSFQSMWYGMTARKIRAFFKALRKAARQEGGAIGFIEEIDAIGGRRGGLESGGDGPVSSGTGGVVNELLVQLQSFDTPPLGERLAGRLVDWVNGWLPVTAQFAKRPPRYNNILVIAATNRGDNLDPALLRPGRFDRRLHFDLPNAVGRRELIDYFLATKAHHPELDGDAMRAELAHITFGYTPVMIEHLLDESLIWALRAGRDGMRWNDISQAKLSEEIGSSSRSPTPHWRRRWWPPTRPATPWPPTCRGSAAASRCSRSSSARTPSGCWPTTTPRSAGPAPGPSRWLS